ncbi:MAG: ATP-binding cassette domain-containing protein, partial [Terriglobales bacterium]
MPNSHVLEQPLAAPTREIHTITILGGQGKNGLPEPLRQVDLKMGDIVSVVGPTGCGKTTLINDIELYANRNTPTGRTVLINGEPLPEDYLWDPSANPIALISQHTNFLSDLPVKVFLETHARIRGVASPVRAVEETVNFANQLTG